MHMNQISVRRTTRHFVRSFVCALTLTFLLVAPRATHAAAGDLDTRFGNGGTVQTDFSGGDDYGFGAKIQSDAKTVVVGQSGVYPLFHTALIRYNKNGALDRTFGNGGKIVAPLDPGGDGSNAPPFQSHRNTMNHRCGAHPHF